MSENSKSLTKAVITNVARGGTKGIPFVGAVLEQMIFGTMDQVEASQQAEELRAALASIQSSIGSDSLTLADILVKVDQQAALGQQTAALLKELTAVMRQGESAEPSPELEQAVEGLFLHLGNRLEDVAGNIEASASKLEQAFVSIDVLRIAVVDDTAPTEVDRISLISALNDLDSVNLGSVIVGLRASPFVAPNAPPQQRVNELVGWADGGGPGLPEVYRVARMLIPNFG